jgi:hypothetical protein
VTPQVIYKAVRDLRMFSLDVGGRTKLYPAFLPTCDWNVSAGNHM